MTFSPHRVIKGLDDVPNAELFAIQTEIARELVRRETRQRLVVDTVDVQFSDVCRVEPPAVGLQLLFPAPSPSNQDGRIYVLLMSTTGTCTVVPKGGRINGATSLALTAVGLYIFANDSTRWYTIATGGGSGAPTNAEYIVGALNGTLTNERLLNNADGTITVDLTVAGAATLRRPAITGDVSVPAGSNVAAIGANVVTNADLAQAAANTFKGNPTAALANEQDIAVGAESIVARTSGNLGTIASAVQTALIRAAGSLFFAAAAAGQHLRRSIAGGDLGFSALEIGLMAGGSGAQTNAVTNISCGSFNYPANSLVAGSTIRLFCHYVLAHSAAPPTLTFEILINGAVVETRILIFLATATTQGGIMWGVVRILTTGAGGTCNVHMGGITDGGTAAASQFGATVTVATDAIDTTVARTMEMRVRMTTAVAANTLTVMAGGNERLS